MKPYFRTVTLLLLFGGALGFAVGCSPPPAKLIAAPPTAQPSMATSRPILCLTLEGSPPQRHTQMNAVSQDGSQVSLSIPGLGATWSPDGRWIAYVAESNELRLTNMSGETKTIFTTDGAKEGILARPMWSADGASIAIIVLTRQQQGPLANSLAIIDIIQQKVRRRYPISTDVIHLPYHFTPPDKFRWSPDGRKVLISWESAVVIHVDTGRVEPIGNTHVIAEWAPGGEAVYYFEVKGTEVGGVPQPKQSLGGFYAKRLGASAVTLMDEPSLVAAGIALSAPMDGLMTLSPRGTRLAMSTGSTKGSGDVIRVYDLQASPLSLDNPVKVVESEEKTIALDWAPDEQSIAVVSGLGEDIKIKLFNLASDEWKVLAAWQLLTGMEMEVFTLKTLSWTQ